MTNEQQPHLFGLNNSNRDFTSRNSWGKNQFNFGGTKTDIEQMIGNAVPIKLAEFVATGILEYIRIDSSVSGGQKKLFDYERFAMPDKVLHTA